MIDTDKYEGHTPAPWLPTHDLVETEAKYGGTFTQVINHDGWRVWVGEKDTDVPHLQNSRFGSENLGEADAKLIADAPKLLAEVKRLRWGIYFALSYTRPTPHTDDPWVACRKSIVEHLKSLIADIEPLSFIPKGDEEE